MLTSTTKELLKERLRSKNGGDLPAAVFECYLEKPPIACDGLLAVFGGAMVFVAEDFLAGDIYEELLLSDISSFKKQEDILETVLLVEGGRTTWKLRHLSADDLAALTALLPAPAIAEDKAPALPLSEDAEDAEDDEDEEDDDEDEDEDEDEENYSDAAQPRWNNEEANQRPKIATYAIVAICCSIASCGCSCLTAIPAFVFAILAIKQINESEGQLTGKGFAIAAIVVSILQIIWQCIYFVMELMAEGLKNVG